jgi:hypothetical protein
MFTIVELSLSLPIISFEFAKKWRQSSQSLNTRQIHNNLRPSTTVCRQKIKKRSTHWFIVNFHLTIQFIDGVTILEGNLTDNCRISEIQKSHSFRRYFQNSFWGTRMSQNSLNSQSIAILTKQIRNHPFLFQHNLWCKQLQEWTSLCFCITKKLTSVSSPFWEVERILYTISSKRCDNRKEPHQNIRDSCAKNKVPVTSKSHKIGYPVRGDIHLRGNFIEVVVKRFEIWDLKFESFVKDRVVKWRRYQEVRGKQRRRNFSASSVSVRSLTEGESSKCSVETKKVWWERYEWNSSKTVLEEELTICEESI